MFHATYKAWEVPFPAIWEVYSTTNFLYATREPMVALRLGSVVISHSNTICPPHFSNSIYAHAYKAYSYHWDNPSVIWKFKIFLSDLLLNKPEFHLIIHDLHSYVRAC